MLSIEPKNCRHSINILLQVDSDSVKKQPETVFIYSLGFFGNVSLIDGKFPYFTQFKHDKYLVKVIDNKYEIAYFGLN